MNKQIIVFGASTGGKWAKELYEKSNYYKIYAFADNNKDKWGTYFLNKKIISPKETLETGYPVVISSLYAMEISKQLEALGIKYDIFDESYCFFSNILIISKTDNVKNISNKYTKYYNTLTLNEKKWDYLFVDLSTNIDVILKQLDKLKISTDEMMIGIHEQNNFEEYKSYLPNLSQSYEMPLIEYLQLQLALEGKQDKALILNEIMINSCCNDYLGDYPLKIYKKEKNILCEIYNSTEKLFESIKIESSFFYNRKYVVSLTQFSCKSSYIAVKGCFYSLNMPLTDNANIDFEFYLQSDKTEIKLDCIKEEECNFSNNLYKYDQGGFVFYINLNQVIEGDYTLALKCTYYNLDIEINDFENTVSFEQRLHNIYTNKSLYSIQLLKNKLNFHVKKINSIQFHKMHCHFEELKKSFKQANNATITKKEKCKLKLALFINAIIKNVLPENIWIVGEKWANSANENGYAFYKRLVEEENIASYFVIDKKSEDYNRVSELGKVLHYKSLKHLIYTLNAKNIFSNGNPNVLLPYEEIDVLMRGNRICLQHGVTYIENQILYDHAIRDRYDFYVSSCATESKILKKRFGFNNNQILEAGISRYDNLENIGDEQRIGIMFTWRKHINTLEELICSDYLNNIYEMVQCLSSQFKNLKIDFCMHPKITEVFIKNDNDNKIREKFESLSNVNVLIGSSTNIVNMIKQTRLLITDFSSVTFDYIYLNKPVIHYIFDYFYVLGLNRENLKESLPGYYTGNLNGVLDYINLYLNNSLPTKTNNISFDFKHDSKNSERLIRMARNI